MSNYSDTGEVSGTGALTAAIIVGLTLLMMGAIASTAINTATTPAAVSVQPSTPANELVVVTAPRLHKVS